MKCRKSIAEQLEFGEWVFNLQTHSARGFRHIYRFILQ